MANFDFQYTCPFIDDAKDNSINAVGDIVLEIIDDIESRYEIKIDRVYSNELTQNYKSRFIDLAGEYFEEIRSINSDMRSVAEDKITELKDRIEELEEYVEYLKYKIEEI